MKKAISFAMAVLFALSLTSVAMAAGTAKKKEMKKKKVGTSTIMGVVAAVDTTAKTITVKRKKGEVTITVTDKTVIKFAAKKKIPLDEVKAGEKIYARYVVYKGNPATYVSIRPAVKAKKVKKAKTTKKAKKAKKAETK